MAHQFPQAADDVGVAAIEFAGADGASECVLVGVTQCGQRGRGCIGSRIEQFTLDDSQGVGRHQSVEVDRTGGGGTHFTIEELGHGGDEFGGGGPAKSPAHAVGFAHSAPSRRSRTSHSFSHTRRPMVASSTDRV